MDTKNVHIFYSNINRLRNKIDDLEVIVLNRKVDIILLTETWLNQNETDSMYIKNFSCIHICRNSLGGGSAIYIRDNIKWTPKTSQITKSNNEFVIINLDELNIKIGVVYRQPSSNVNVFNEETENILNNNKRLILVGDINIDLYQNNTTTLDYKDTIISSGYNILNKIEDGWETRINKTTGTKTIIDHIITDLNDLDITYTTGLYPLSDHKFITLNINRINPKKTITKQPYTFKKFNYKNLQQQLEIRLKENKENLNFKLLTEIIINETKSNTKTITQRYADNLKQGWITQNLLNKMKERDKIYKTHIKYPENEYIAQKLHLLKKEIRNLINYNKKEYYSKKLKDSKYSSRKTWKVLKEIIKPNEDKEKSIAQITDNDISIINPKEICQILNNHFKTAATKILKDIPTTNSHKKFTLIWNTDRSMRLKLTEEVEILKIINNLKTKAAPGEDGIKSGMIKKIKYIITPYLVQMINKNMKEGVFPEELKTAKITPIYKGGARHDCNNYRPISVLNVLSKIFEKVLLNRLKEYLDEINFLNQEQNGFQNGRNTETAASTIFNYINEQTDKKLLVAALNLDLKKAFDTVNHQILLEKMSVAGINGPALRIFRSYLDKRRQYTIVNGEKSEKAEIDHGVPQGSILGPLLFLIYINDFVNCQLKGKVSHYADDTIIFYSGQNAAIINNIIKEDIKLIEEWCCTNKLCLNINKCEVITFGETKWELNVTIKNKILENKKSIKYLGLILDRELKFKEHIEQLKTKLSKFTGLLRRSAHLITPEMKNQIYYAYINSQLSYLTSVWGTANKSDLERLQRTQNKAIKTLYNLKYRTPTIQVYSMTNYLNISEIIQYHSIKLIYNIKNNLLKSPITLTENRDIHNHYTRSAENLHLTHHRTKKTQKDIKHNAIMTYNNIPQTIKDIKNIKQFKIKLKMYLLSQRRNTFLFK